MTTVVPVIPPTTIEPLLAAKEIAVFCGSGGVGKTSVSAAAALGATVELGGKVLVLTIDPAKRLASALGLDGFGNLAKRVPPEALKAAGIEPRGELWAAQLDTKQSWDDLVLRHAQDEETAYRILENRLYHNLTARFVQSHDYIAMERLYEIHSSGQYDLIIIDTPPTRNAIDFLEAPARMADFFGSRLLKWLTLPGRVGGKRGSRVLNVASKPFYQVADRILGSQFLEDIAEFFLNFQSMYDGFVQRAQAVERLLHDRRTTFAVVTTLEAAPLHEAERFCAELKARKFHLGALILNKTLPDLLLDPAGAAAATASIEDAAPVAAALADTGDPALADPARTARVLRTIGESYRNFSVVAMREAELRAELAGVPDVVARIPTFEDDISDVESLAAISRYLFGGVLCVSTLDDLALARTSLDGSDLLHMERLVAAWQPLADLSFTDLLLFVPITGEEGHRFVVLAQVRPATGQTNYPQDLVGTVVDEVNRPLLARCWRAGEIVKGDTAALSSKDRVRVQATPIRRNGRLIGLMTREEPMTLARRSGELERVYFDVFDRFGRMIAEGSFPFDVDEVEMESAPRVGDGVIVIDGETRVQFASPNAVSSLHRMGIHAYAQNQRLADVGFDDAAAKTAMLLTLPIAEEIERDDVSILVRVLPTLDGGTATGALVLMRDVSDLRRRDRMLLSKDATIREIHHRVKNNLQTIASLLRLQGRRLQSPEARAALAESERRIRSIAIVHETLSREAGDVVAFNEIVRPLARLVEETSSSEDHMIRFRVEGDAGELPGEVATPLAVVLNELMQNAVDHAFPEGGGSGVEARVEVTLERDADHVSIEVRDNGAGLPERFTLEGSRGLGLSIVQALVTSELQGSIEMHHDNGTSVRVRVPVAMPRVEL